jgi:hypothetical protein
MRYALAIGLLALGCSNGSGPSSLAGTWELAGATGSTPAGTLVLSSSRLTINLGGDVFDLQVSGTPTLSWTDHGSPTPINTIHNGGSFNSGALGLGLGGDWGFSGASGGSCSASLQSGSFVGSCAGAGYGPLFNLNRHATATRTAQLDSIFGDLGGMWTVSDDNNGSCAITVQGATISASCKSGGARWGGVTLTFGDGLVSGTTDSGDEFSARRQ